MERDVGAAQRPEDEADALVRQIAAYDAQIATLERDVAQLPQLLARLAGHPALWLLLGREGVDRPASDWSTLVGHQLVPIQRTSWRLLALVAGVALAVGAALGGLAGLSW